MGPHFWWMAPAMFWAYWAECLGAPAWWSTRAPRAETEEAAAG